MQNGRFLFRRQFILGPEPAQRLNGWQHTRVSNDCVITSHPDLDIATVSAGNSGLAVLGFMLDPYAPSRGNQEILRDILEQIADPADAVERTSSLGGRYSLIVRVGARLLALNDAAGFRQIFYHQDNRGRIWCASQPALLAEELGLEVDPDIHRELFALPMFSETSEYWFPGNTTLVKNVFHLAPNHYLDLQDGTVERFWPNRTLEEISVQQCIETAVPILQGLVESAARRFDLAFGITAGLDSRVLLAACRSIKERIHFFTHTHATLRENGADVRIPRQILSRFGLEHHLLQSCEHMDKEFENTLRRSVTAAREGKGLNAFAIFQHFESIQKEMLVINGNCGEITRSYYRLPCWYALTGAALALLAGMKGSVTAKKQFDMWIESAPGLRYRVDLLDLFYWENRNANWGAMSYGEYDIAFESFSPFNCRRLTETLLSSAKKYRMPPHYDLHRGLIRDMWPELLEYPINPPADKKSKMLQKLKSFRLFDYVRLAKLVQQLYSA